MSETTTAVVAKKSSKKTEGKPEKKGLRKAQVKVLQVLLKADGLNRQQIAEKSGCDLAWMNSWIGSNDKEVRAKNDAKEFPCLLTLGYVKVVPATSDDIRGTCYSISSNGRKALEKIQKEEKSKK